jgi:hypothetical protein
MTFRTGRAPCNASGSSKRRRFGVELALRSIPNGLDRRAGPLTATVVGVSRPYVVGARLHGLPAGLGGRTLLAGVCLAGERLRLTP